MDEGIMTVDIGTSSIRVSLFRSAGKCNRTKISKAFAPAQFDAEEQLEKMLSLMRQVRGNVFIYRSCSDLYKYSGKLDIYRERWNGNNTRIYIQ